MNKICTSLEQSKRLIELGIDTDTADMCYRIVAYNPNNTHVYQPYCFVRTLESDIPAWSLATLLNIMPKHIKKNDGRTYEFHIFNDDGIVIQKWGCSYVADDYHNRAEYSSDPNLIYPTNIYGSKYEDILDAVFDMVCWLLRNKKI